MPTDINRFIEFAEQIQKAVGCLGTFGSKCACSRDCSQIVLCKNVTVKMIPMQAVFVNGRMEVAM